MLEVLVALALVALALLSLSSLTTTGLSGSYRSQKLTIATMLAQETLELARLEGYRPALQHPEDLVEDYGEVEQYPQFKRVVSRIPHQPATGLQTIMVAVLWDHDAHSVRLSTILGE